MTTRERLLQEIDQCSEEMLNEVMLFVSFLKSKSSQESNGWLWAAESSLAKEWLAPPEDEAWKNL